MPKTNVVYGKSYKPCPCAQINDYVTTDNTYFTSTCFSPKRKACKISDVNQVRICMGGTSHGRRYTSCPFYVKNAQINVPKRTRRSSTRKIIYHIIGCSVFWIMASSSISSGAEYSIVFGLIFLTCGIWCIASLFKKHEKIDTGEQRKKYSRK